MGAASAAGSPLGGGSSSARKVSFAPTDSLVEVREYEVEDRRGAVAEAVRFSALFCVVFCVAHPNPECPPKCPKFCPLPPRASPSPLGSPLPSLPPLQLEFRNTYQAEVEKERLMLMQQRQAQTANPWAESSMPTFAPAADGPQPTVAWTTPPMLDERLWPESKGELSAEREAQQRRRRETPEVKYTRVQDVPGTPAEPPLEQQAPDRDDRLTPIVPSGQGRGAAGARARRAAADDDQRRRRPRRHERRDGRRRRRRQRRDAGDAEHAADDGRRYGRRHDGRRRYAERHAGRRHAGRRHAERHAVAADGRRRHGRRGGHRRRHAAAAWAAG